MKKIYKEGDEKFLVALQSISNPDIQIIGHIDSKWFKDQYAGDILSPVWVIKDEFEDEFEEEVVEQMFSFYEENGNDSNFDNGWTYAYILR